MLVPLITLQRLDADSNKYVGAFRYTMSFEGYLCVEAHGVIEFIVYLWLETHLCDVLKEIGCLSSSSCDIFSAV